MEFAADPRKSVVPKEVYREDNFEEDFDEDLEEDFEEDLELEKLLADNKAEEALLEDLELKKLLAEEDLEEDFEEDLLETGPKKNIIFEDSINKYQFQSNLENFEPSMSTKLDFDHNYDDHTSHHEKDSVARELVLSQSSLKDKVLIHEVFSSPKGLEGLSGYQDR